MTIIRQQIKLSLQNLSLQKVKLFLKKRDIQMSVKG